MPEQDSTPTVVPPASPSAATRKPRGRSRLLDIALLSRWRRRKLIQEIEAATGRTLLCYVSIGAIIAPSDIFDLIRLLQKVDSGASITLLLDSPGGYIDSAEKMVHLLREACESSSSGNGDLEVVVPYQAKSAATLIALGADQIVMSDSSELGPIDPQVPYSEGHTVSAMTLIRAYEKAEARCMTSPNNPAFAAELGMFDAVIVEAARQAVSRSRVCAERLLKRKGANYTAIADALLDIERFPSHGQMIDWRTALQIGIPHVHRLDRQSPLWQQYWHLYRQLLAVCGAGRRVFESRDLTILTQ